MKGLVLKVSVIGLIAGCSGSFIYDQIKQEDAVYITQPQQPVISTVHEAGSPELNQDFVQASEASTRSVVFIKTSSNNDYGRHNWYDWFFEGRGGESVSSGSGVIYSEDGYIVTNNHVIEKADNIEVIHEKRAYNAEVVGTDPSSDLAVLKIDGKSLPAIKTGSSRELNVGEWVLAVGNPFNLTSTVTAGIVSAKARNINILNSQFPIESFIQTDAAINPGNSGGALVNIRGELVGINTAILSKTGSYAGYGFAVPVDIVNKVVNDLISYGEVQKAFFGADVTEVNMAIAEEFKLEDVRGVMLNNLLKDGAAERAGLKENDIVLKINDIPVSGKSSFDECISYHSPGDKVKVIYKRGGEIGSCSLTLTNREGTTEILKRRIYSSKELGADLEAISRIEKTRLNIQNGVRILEVRRGFISRLGISEGFVITEVNDHPVTTPEELVGIFKRVRGNVIIEGITKSGTKGYYRFYF